MSANLGAIKARNGNNYVKSVSSQQSLHGIIWIKVEGLDAIEKDHTYESY